MLATYEALTAQLLQNPSAPTPLYSTANLDQWINIARRQLCGEAEAVVSMGTLALTAGVNSYPFSAVVFPTASSVSGIQGPLSIRQAWRQVASGQVWMRPRPWPWFSFYELNNPVPQQGPPTVWAQYGQGTTGSIYVSRVPDQTYTMNVDMPCYPIDLVTDATVEVIPPLWQDAVPYYAAYMALLSAQNTARLQDALRYFQIYEQFVARARNAATPSVLSGLYSQQPSMVRANQLGTGGGGGPAQPQGGQQ